MNFGGKGFSTVTQSTITRRHFLARSACGGLLTALAPTIIARASAADPKVPLAEAFDREVLAFMEARKVPGGALAVVKDQRLVYARGYGWADRERQEPVKAESLFRIASISKPFTAVGLLQLVAAGKLELEQRVFDVLDLEKIAKAGKLDPRWRAITLRQLLHHTGGWDRDASGDPMFKSREIATATGSRAPAQPEAIIRFQLGRPLDFDPGTRYVYSNFGYCLLGRVIEKVAGVGYEQFMRERVLAPLGITRMRLGASLAAGRLPGEVHYYTPRDEKGRAVFPGEKNPVPVPDGGFCLEAMDAHGGWLASAVDLARFAAGLDNPQPMAGLPDRVKQLLYEPPAAPVSRRPDGSLADFYYGCGWLVRPIGRKGKANYWHNGSLPGTSTLLVRRFDGLSWAVLFNQRSEDGKLPDGAIDAALHRAADAVAAWPTEDLFPRQP